MFLYKLRKVFKEKLPDISKGSALLSAVASFIPFAPFLLLHVEDLSINEKKQMIFVSILFLLVDLFMIYWIDVIFNYGIITTLFVASSFSFLLFFIPCFCFLTWLEFGEMVLEKDEIREAKLNSLFRKLF
jgi:hypothetical protein